MDDKYRGWDEETYILSIGPESKQLFVPRKILTQIPYFSSALKSGNFVESEKKTFHLPDDDAQAVADVLFFTYTGKVEELPGAQDDDPDPEVTTRIKSYLRAYIFADKCKAESTANDLASRIIECYDRKMVDPGTISILGEAGLHATPLYGYLLQAIAMDYQRGFYTMDNAISSDYEKSMNFEEACNKMSREELLRLVVIAADPEVESKFVHAAKGETYKLCKYHKHDLTKECTEE